MYKLIIFLVASMGILAFSWKSLHDRRSHGFWRFFAFESILILILLNVQHWFSDPFSFHQIVSWLLLLCSLFLVIHGFYLLRFAGKPEGDIENTTMLVTTGAYRYIRHPLYASLLYLGWGVFLKDVSLLTVIFVLAATASLFAMAKVEEKENIERFEEEYVEYMKKTKRFVPFFF